MRNREDFESLVFERAEEIKARDRAAKTIRLSIMPIAAAFLVLTAVGIHRFTSMNTSFSDAAAPASDASGEAYYNAPQYDDRNTTAGAAPAEKYAFADEEAPAENFENYDYDGVADVGEAEKTDEAQDAQTKQSLQAEQPVGSVTVTFYANEKLTLTGEQASVLAAALDCETFPTDSADSGYIGKLTVEGSGAKTVYYLYSDHLKKVKGGSVIGTFALNDSTKVLLEEAFGVEW